jgi:cyclase
MMKPLGLLLLSFAVLNAFEYGLSPHKISKRIYCFFGKPEAMDQHNNGNMVNTCYVDAGRRWLVIDSGPTYAYAKEAAETMQRIKPMPIGLVINTHVHDDHWLGNGYYESRGIDVLGPSRFKTAVNPDETTRMQKRISASAYAGTDIKLPTRYVDANATLMLGNLEVRLIRVDRTAHTEEDLMVFVPALNTLFAGDLIFNDRIPSLRDGDINGWIAELETIRSIPLQHLIGGHGDRTDTAAADFTYRYLVALRDRVREAIENDTGIAEATKSIRLDAFRNAALYDIMHKQNVEAAYRMLEWEDE